MKEIIYNSKYSDVEIFKEKEKKWKKNWKSSPTLTFAGRSLRLNDERTDSRSLQFSTDIGIKTQY